jgi:hypothetical protein
MSRLFTHHDRLYLWVSGGGSQDKPPAEAKEPNNGIETEDERHAPASDGTFALFIPHFHKVFGLLALLNMLLYLTPYFHNFEKYFGHDRMIRFSFIHLILALSSFEFRIGRARNGIYTIYREMQLHTIIFTFRSWTALMCAWYFDVTNIVSRSCLVLFWHVMADLATYKYQPPSRETTIRRSVDGKMGYQDQGRIAHMGLWFFSFSQLVGTYMLLTDTPDVARDAMFIMTPVQVSAFLATLVRKGYCRSQTSVSIYFLILLPIFFYHHWTLLDVAMVAFAQTFRFRLRLNKYVVWISIALTVAFLHGDLQAWLKMYIPDAAAVLPSPPVLPKWFLVDTVQPGSAIGRFIASFF